MKKMEEEKLKREKIRALIGITRPVNWLMAGIGVIAGCLAGVGLNPVFILPISLAFLSTVFVTAGGNSLNDYFDRNIDIIAHGKRSLASGKLHPEIALYFAITSFIIGVILTAFINWECLGIVLFNFLIIIAYEIFLKKRGFVGNLAIGYLVGSTFWFGGAAVGEIFLNKIIFMAVLASLVNTGREILKDVIDISGDRGVRKTLPMRIGEKKSLIISASFISLAIILSFLTWFWRILGENEYTYVILGIANALFITSIFSMSRSYTLDRSSTLLKIGMIIALIPFILGGVL